MDYYPNYPGDSSAKPGQCVSIPTVWPQAARYPENVGGTMSVSFSGTDKDPNVVASYVHEIDKHVEALHAEISELFQRLDKVVPKSNEACCNTPSLGPRGSSPLALELYSVSERLQFAARRIREFRQLVEL